MRWNPNQIKNYCNSIAVYFCIGDGFQAFWKHSYRWKNESEKDKTEKLILNMRNRI